MPHDRPDRTGALAPVASADGPAREDRTPGQGGSGRRDLIIANRHGASRRLQADVSDLPHSRISAIL
jgi:hypothetical protein